MSGDVCIYSWPCSYYLDIEKRWVPGKLSLLPCSLKFTTDIAGEVLVGLPLSSIVEIRKEASHFIFSAITVLEKGHLKHWFGSLRPSRNAVFNIIEHFWRELLLSPPGAAAEVTPSPITRGQELTGLMASSQRRLEDTAKVLHHQGEQLDSVMKDLEKMDSDLDVADRFEREDLDDIKVHSPYEISIRQRFIGRPDVAYRVISAKMPEVIPLLEVQFSKKIELPQEASVLRSTGASSSTERSWSFWHAAPRLRGCTTQRELPEGGQEGGQLQLQRDQPLLSERETQELTQILAKLKGLALDTETELERQDEALGGITAAVDRATLTVDKHNRRMKRLT
ncbi:synaptosomal-associated protein 47 isoform X2 [Marmota monax]|uniref:synaptosomal-associated protein 47 isoform X2 n=1 Tax=Marmota monax TaxID=9995 RepID=UPI001EB050E1|nr:synaptosomal-associated protein 47 isoform X2 [Marmota monax]